MGIKTTLSPFQEPLTSTPEGAGIVQCMSDMLRPLLSKEILDGVLLTNISLTSGVTNRISHKLQRAVLGYFVVRSDTNSTFWDSDDDNLNRSLFLNLHCSASCIVSLWVF